MILRPTGQCFDDAFELLIGLANAKETHDEVWEDQRYVLEHGICLMPLVAQDGNSEPFAHAWVLDRSKHWILTATLEMPPLDLIVCMLPEPRSRFGYRFYYMQTDAVFERDWRPQKRTTYTILDAMQHNERTNNFGPWEPEFIALTKPRA